MKPLSKSAGSAARLEQAPGGESRWPWRVALATFWASVPLVLFGGTVTTLRAGMAEDGWLRPDGFFLWLYPLELRMRNLGVFVEHSHRELGSLVGLLAILLVVVTWLGDQRRSARGLALLALFAICVQGALGGFRVLQNDPDLAFLHGAIAQAVFALLACVALCLSPRWRASAPAAHREAPRTSREPSGLARQAGLATAVVYLQIVIGAWYRHSGAALALALHVMLALGVLGVVASLARDLGRAAEPAPHAQPVLVRARRRLLGLLWTQIALGVLATFTIFELSGGAGGQVSAGEAVFATLHVAVGALLLAQCAASALWARRLFPSSRESAEGVALGEGALLGGPEALR